MRVMLMIKGDPQPGAAPSGELLGELGRYNDELKEAGMLIDWRGFSRAPWGGVCGSWSRIYPGEYGAEVEIEIRQVFEPGSEE